MTDQKSRAIIIYCVPMHRQPAAPPSAIAVTDARTAFPKLRTRCPLLHALRRNAGPTQAGRAAGRHESPCAGARPVHSLLLLIQEESASWPAAAARRNLPHCALALQHERLMSGDGFDSRCSSRAAPCWTTALQQGEFASSTLLVLAIDGVRSKSAALAGVAEIRFRIQPGGR